MTSRMRGRSIADLIDAWYASSDEVYRLAESMLTAGMFRHDKTPEAELLLAVFEKPWHYDAQRTWWVANDWTDDQDEWEQGADDEWRIE